MIPLYSIGVIVKQSYLFIMKTYLKTRTYTKIAVAGIFLLLFSACKKYDNAPAAPTRQTYTANVQLNGANEVPAVTTTGTGTANITYYSDTKTITYTLNWQLGSTSATTTGMHFHGSDTGGSNTSSPIVIEITGFTSASSGSLTGTTRALTDTEAAQLLAGKWYVNIHSSTFPSGEMRANIALINTSTGTGNGGGNGY
jgi:hypothetical protein